MRIMCAIGAGILATAALAQSAKPDWIADPRTGCRVWNIFPVSGQTINWSGACQNGLAQGEGVVQWFRDGKPSSRYEGAYRDGRANGQGVLTAKSGNRYEGEFRDDQPNGRGVFTYESGNRYEGEVKDGRRHGRGVYALIGGDRHEGEFRDGKAHGRGVYTSAGGDRFVGEFRDGKAHGAGSFARGQEEFSGTWSNGCFRQGSRTAVFGRTAKECGFE